MKILNLIPLTDGKLVIHQRDSDTNVARTVLALAVVEEDGEDRVEMMVVVDGTLVPSRFGHFPGPSEHYIPLVELDGRPVNLWDEP